MRFERIVENTVCFKYNFHSLVCCWAHIPNLFIGNAGGHALKLLNTFLGNIVKCPEETKYRSINAESNAFKAKLATLVGPIALLKALGFVKSSDNKYILVR